MNGAALAYRRSHSLSVANDEGLGEPLPSVTAHHLSPNLDRVLFVTPEMADLLKIGGLGDVAAALPRALREQQDIRLLMPGFPEVVNSRYSLRVVGQVPGYAAVPPAKIGRIDLDDGLILYVVICPGLYEREGTPYGDAHGRDWPDNHIRYARLALAAADIAADRAGLLWQPELVHANDWPTGLTPAYMRWRGLSTPCVFTIHNLGYPGLCDFSQGAELGLPGSAYGIDGMEFYGRLSFLKAGISYADRVTTVSKTYAREITTQALGCGLDGLLRGKLEQGVLSGIPNGIDDSWDPQKDPHLIAPFSLHQWRGRELNASYVRNRFALDMDQAPLFAVVSRLVHQKGIDLTLQLADSLVEQGGQLVLMGKGEPAIEEAVRELVNRYPGRIGAEIGFNENDARRIYAGSDFLLMPSRYEPGGLSQMYAQRYGSLPIATRTGGLADSIEDSLTGFLFDKAELTDYRQAIGRALNVFGRRELLQAMRCRAMLAPFFWRLTALPYRQLYRSLLHKAQLPTYISS